MLRKVYPLPQILRLGRPSLVWYLILITMIIFSNIFCPLCRRYNQGAGVDAVTYDLGNDNQRSVTFDFNVEGV